MVNEYLARMYGTVDVDELEKVAEQEQLLEEIAPFDEMGRMMARAWMEKEAGVGSFLRSALKQRAFAGGKSFAKGRLPKSMPPFPVAKPNFAEAAKALKSSPVGKMPHQPQNYGGIKGARMSNEGVYSPSLNSMSSLNPKSRNLLMKVRKDYLDG